MNTFCIILLTLVIYSLICTIVYVVTNENEEVAIAFGLGGIGLSLSGLCKIYYKIKNKLKYHIGKRSIFEERATGKKYKCKTKDACDIEWLADYKIVKRYADKNIWKDIPDFSEEVIACSKINCDNCKYVHDCNYEYPINTVKCKNDCGTVIEFDKFEKR